MRGSRVQSPDHRRRSCCLQLLLARRAIVPSTHAGLFYSVDATGNMTEHVPPSACCRRRR